MDVCIELSTCWMDVTNTVWFTKPMSYRQFSFAAASIRFSSTGRNGSRTSTTDSQAGKVMA